jgi:hypothetical protein
MCEQGFSGDDVVIHGELSDDRPHESPSARARRRAGESSVLMVWVWV